MDNLPAVVQGEVLPPLRESASASASASEPGIAVSAAPHPFRAANHVGQFPHGSTIQDILDIVQPDPVLRAHSKVFIEDSLIDPAYYSRVTPKLGTRVYIRVVPHGGGGGKNPLRTLLFIAVIAASFVVPGLLFSQATLGATILGTGATALTVGGAIQAGIVVLGGLLVNALVPPPRPRLQSRASTEADSPTLSIAAARNQVRLYGTVPRLLGKHALVPSYAALPYTEIVGDDQFVTMLFLWSIGPITLEDERIGETSLDSFEGVTKEFRRGYLPGQLVPRGSWTPTGGGYPRINDFGHYYTASVAATVDGVDYVAGDTIVRNHMSDSSRSSAWDKNGNKPVTLYNKIVRETQLGIKMVQSDGWVRRTTKPNTDTISLDFVFPQGLVSYNDRAEKESVTARIRIQHKRVSSETWINSGEISATGTQTNALRRNFTIDVDRGEYDVRVRRVTAAAGSDKVRDELYWSILRTITDAYPIDMEGVALTAMRIKATDQLRGNIDTYNAVGQSILPDYAGGSWAYRPTSNPAAAFREVLQGPGNARPVYDRRLNLDVLEDWYDWCDDKGFEFNNVRDFSSSVYATLQDIASAGRASPTIVDGKWGVIIDRVRDTAVQHFTPRNTWDFSFNRSFPDVPHGFRVRFLNKDARYQDDEITVYDDGYSRDNATKFETLELVGMTTIAQIHKFARYFLAVAQLRLDEYSFNVDVEYVIAQRGDLVLLTHDAIAVGIKGARIKGYTYSGSTVTHIILDEEVTLESEHAYAVSIRSHALGQTVLRVRTFPGDTDTLQLRTPISSGDAPEVGALVGVGIAGSETSEVLIKSVEPQAGLTARITCVEYNEGIYTADTQPIPPYNSRIGDGIAGRDRQLDRINDPGLIADINSLWPGQIPETPPGASGADGQPGIPGPSGMDGTPGTPGADGRTSYFHVAYANDRSGGGFSQDPTGKSHIGTYVDFSSTDSTDPNDYTWTRFEGLQGPDGLDGIAGENGENGETSYLHIAYADDANGGGFSQSPNGKKYLGTYVDFNPTDSSDPDDYTWARFEGLPGFGLEYIFAKTANILTAPPDPDNDWEFDSPEPPWYDSAPSLTVDRETLWTSQRSISGIPPIVVDTRTTTTRVSVHSSDVTIGADSGVWMQFDMYLYNDRGTIGPYLGLGRSSNTIQYPQVPQTLLADSTPAYIALLRIVKDWGGTGQQNFQFDINLSTTRGGDAGRAGPSLSEAYRAGLGLMLETSDGVRASFHSFEGASTSGDPYRWTPTESSDFVDVITAVQGGATVKAAVVWLGTGSNIQRETQEIVTSETEEITEGGDITIHGNWTPPVVSTRLSAEAPPTTAGSTRPDDPLVGALHVDPDGVIYRWDGTAWVNTMVDLTGNPGSRIFSGTVAAGETPPTEGYIPALVDGDVYLAVDGRWWSWSEINDEWTYRGDLTGPVGPQGPPGDAADDVDRGPGIYHYFLTSSQQRRLVAGGNTLPSEFVSIANALTVGSNVDMDAVRFHRNGFNSWWRWYSDTNRWTKLLNWVGAADIDAVNMSSINVDVGGTIQSTNYIAGTRGWRISWDGSADFADVRNVKILWSGSGVLVETASESSGVIFRVDEDVNNFDYLEFSVVLQNEGWAGFIIVDLDRVPTTYGNFGTVSSGSRPVYGFAFSAGSSEGNHMVIRMRRLSSTRIRLWNTDVTNEGYVYKIIGVRETR